MNCDECGVKEYCENKIPSTYCCILALWNSAKEEET